MGILDTIFGSLFGSQDAKTAAKAQVDAAETPTRQSGIEQLLRNVASNKATEEEMQMMEEVFGTEAITQLQKSTSTESFTGTTDSSQTQSQDKTGTEKTEQTSQQQVQRGTEEQQAALDNLVSNLSGDSSARFDAAMQQVLRSGMPAVANVGNRSGSFDSTTQAAIQNDLITKAAAAGLQAEDSQNSQLIAALEAGMKGNETITGEQSTEAQTMQQILAELQNQERTNSDKFNSNVTESESNKETSQSREAEQSKQGNSSENVSEGSTSLSDVFTDVGDHINTPSGSALDDIRNQGYVGEGKNLGEISTPSVSVEGGQNPPTDFDIGNPVNPGITNPIVPGGGGGGGISDPSINPRVQNLMRTAGGASIPVSSGQGSINVSDGQRQVRTQDTMMRTQPAPTKRAVASEVVKQRADNNLAKTVGSLDVMPRKKRRDMI